MPQGEKPAQLHDHLHQHIQLIARQEQEFLAERTGSERLGDWMASFIGSLTFIAVNVAIFLTWIGWNLMPGQRLPHFDPTPFPILDVLLAFEAILVASFILMRQSRMSRRSEERDHLMLQILLLTEREITALLGMEREVAEGMGMTAISNQQELEEMSQQTPIEEVAQGIKQSLSTE